MEIYEKVNIYFRICGNLNTHTLGFVHTIAGSLGIRTAPKVSSTLVGFFRTGREKVAKFLNQV
jgi:hypothetical protein